MEVCSDKYRSGYKHIFSRVSTSPPPLSLPPPVISLSLPPKVFSSEELYLKASILQSVAVYDMCIYIRHNLISKEELGSVKEQLKFMRTSASKYIEGAESSPILALIIKSTIDTLRDQLKHLADKTAKRLRDPDFTNYVLI